MTCELCSKTNDFWSPTLLYGDFLVQCSAAGHRENLLRTHLPALFLPTSSPIILLYGYLHVYTQDTSTWAEQADLSCLCFFPQEAHMLVLLLYIKTYILHCLTCNQNRRTPCIMASKLPFTHHNFPSFQGKSFFSAPIQLCSCTHTLVTPGPNTTYLLPQQHSIGCLYMGKTLLSMHTVEFTPKSTGGFPQEFCHWPLPCTCK